MYIQINILLISIYTQSSRKPTGPKTEANEFEVGPVKEVRLAFGFSNFFMIFFRGSVKIIAGPVNSDNQLVLLASKFKKIFVKTIYIHKSVT
jgi:hypothetical protein